MWMDNSYLKRKKLMDRWKESFQEKLSDHGQLNLEIRTKKLIVMWQIRKKSETTYMEVRDKVLKFKYRKTQGLNVITTDIAIYMWH